MPAANHVILASGAAVAVSVAVATAIALYESPEFRRYADDVRRRIAVALHAIGEGIDPPHREPLFNRPEDAHGFMQSSRGEGAEPGVDADEETRRRQREELLYWNSQLLEKEKEMDEKQAAIEEPTPVRRLTNGSRGSSFDDFLRQDEGAEKGTFVFSSGTDAPATDGLRHRGEASASAYTIRGMPASVFANPFADEHFIVGDDIETAQASQVVPSRDEVMSDIYSATTQEHPQSPKLDMREEPESLIDLRAQSPVQTQSSVTVDGSPAPEEYMTPGQESQHDDAYASIQAWAQSSEQGFYSPLPSTPRMPVSEAGSEPDEFLTEGQLTPTDSVSIIGSHEDFGNDGVSTRNGSAARPYDVISESDGMMTPASWSEVGSVISESDVAPAPMRA
ncbi:unnamed protein product [Clonostachys byssicola]|uniref:Uncharacterized protein n=1 Tax=Clonostachys byssicola TaxID=160290 RepID=A0A9N9URC0_9HYPO|nr:unnamed protein product [Clonostachys byssicola]